MCKYVYDNRTLTAVQGSFSTFIRFFNDKSALNATGKPMQLVIKVLKALYKHSDISI